MKGIYLTPEGKALIEAKIAELATTHCENSNEQGSRDGKLFLLSQILSNAPVLPSEESWEAVENKLNYHCGKTGCSKDGAILKEYDSGVIIQPKNNCGVHIHNPKTGYCKCGHKVEIKTFHST